MRTLTTAESKMWTAGGFAVHARVSVKDSGGTWRDLSSLEGHNWGVRVRYGSNIDEPVAHATVELVRSRRALSLATLHETSKLNQVSGVYSPLLLPGRELKIETAMAVRGTTPVSGDWRLVFHGYVDRVAWDRDPIVLECRDLGARLQDWFLKVERVYGLERMYQWAPAWVGSVTRAAGEIVKPTAGTPTGCWEYIYSSGTTGASEPTWPTTRGPTGYVNDGTQRIFYWGALPTKYGARPWKPSLVVALGDVIAAPRGTVGGVEVFQAYDCTLAGTTASTTPDFAAWATDNEITDGTAKFRRRGVYSSAQVGTPLHQAVDQLLMDNLGAGNYTLWVPTASTWFLRQWLQQRQPIMEAIRSLALQVGWDFRAVFNSSSGNFEFKLYQPDRTKSSVDKTFATAEVRDLRKLELAVDAIRNSIDVVYLDRSALQANGVDYVRKTVNALDTTSRDKYGGFERWAEIAEDFASRVNSSTEAQSLADSVLADLKEPVADIDVELRSHFYAAELGDRYTVTADGFRFTANQTVSVVAVEHSVGGGSGKTILTCRSAKPAGGCRVWLERMTGPSLTRPAKLTGTVPLCAALGVSVANFAGRSEITFSPSRNNADLEAELYVSTTSNFAPAAGTLKERGRTNRFVYFEAGPVTRYGRIILRDRAGNASAPSSEFTIAPT